MYYQDKIDTLKEIFGVDKIELEKDFIIVGNKKLPVLNDVIILRDTFSSKNFESERVRFSFGKEWSRYNKILPEHKKEFEKYFNMIDLNELKGKRVCDLGCGIGRFSYFLKDVAREIICIDFSEAIFVARNNLAKYNKFLFFMADLRKLPFVEDFADFIFSLGVLHHLSENALDELRKLKRFSPKILVYLYYNFDNRPVYFKLIIRIVALIRKMFSKIKIEFFRLYFSKVGAIFIYYPFILLGKILKPFSFASYIPLYDSYFDKSIKRIEQDVYDRFFTPIEQRFSKKEILNLKDTFSEIIISENHPYWHFLCKK